MAFAAENHANAGETESSWKDNAVHAAVKDIRAINAA